MMEDSTHARNHDLSAAAEIFANGTYFPNTLRSLEEDVFVEQCCGQMHPRREGSACEPTKVTVQMEESRDLGSPLSAEGSDSRR
jgi:hypothetical protein